MNVLSNVIEHRQIAWKQEALYVKHCQYMNISVARTSVLAVALNSIFFFNTFWAAQVSANLTNTVDMQSIAQVSSQDRDQVINQNRALSGFTLEQSRNLVWKQLEKNFEDASNVIQQLSVLNAMAKLVVHHQYQPEGIQHPNLYLLAQFDEHLKIADSIQRTLSERTKKLILDSKAWKDLLLKSESGLTDSELDRVVNRGETLSPRYDLKASRVLAWIELEKRVSYSTHEKIKITSLNAMAKLLINQGFRPLHLERPIRITLDLFSEAISLSGAHQVPSELRRAYTHAMAWYALLMMDPGLDQESGNAGTSSHQGRYQRAWDLLGKAHSAGFSGTDSLLVWKAKLIIDYHFIPALSDGTQLTHLQAIEMADELLKQVGVRYQGTHSSTQPFIQKTRDQIPDASESSIEHSQEGDEAVEESAQVEKNRDSAADVYHISFVNQQGMQALQFRLSEDVKRMKAEELRMDVVGSTPMAEEHRTSDLRKRKRRIIVESEEEEELDLEQSAPKFPRSEASQEGAPRFVVRFESGESFFGDLSNSLMTNYLDDPAPDNDEWKVQLISPITDFSYLRNSYWNVIFKDQREAVILKHDPLQPISLYLLNPKNSEWEVYLIDRNGRLESEDQRYRCSRVECLGSAFTTSQALSNHQMLVHSGYQPCLLEDCGELFETQEEMKTHGRSAHGLFICQEEGCTRFYLRQKGLDQHIISHHKMLRYTCKEPGCGKSYTQSGNLATHMREEHTEHPRHPCTWPGCNATFRQKANIPSHIETVHKKSKLFHCPWEGCSKTSSHLGNLNSHIKRDHRHENTRVNCTEEGCSRDFSSKSQMQRHIKKDHLGEIELFKCTWPGCTREFQSKPGMRSHINSYHKNRRFTCDQGTCRESYSQRSGLYKHLKRDHGLKGTPCPVEGCKKSFYDNRGMGQHLTKDHPNYKN